MGIHIHMHIHTGSHIYMDTKYIFKNEDKLRRAVEMVREYVPLL